MLDYGEVENLLSRDGCCTWSHRKENFVLEAHEKSVPQETEVRSSAQAFLTGERHQEDIAAEATQLLAMHLVREQAPTMWCQAAVLYLGYTAAEPAMPVVFPKDRSTMGESEERAVQRGDLNAKEAKDVDADRSMLMAVVESDDCGVSAASLSSSKALNQVQAADSYLVHWVVFLSAIVRTSAQTFWTIPPR